MLYNKNNMEKILKTPYILLFEVLNGHIWVPKYLN